MPPSGASRSIGERRQNSLETIWVLFHNPAVLLCHNLLRLLWEICSVSDIFVMLRNQDNIALTSIDGIPFVTLLRQNEWTVAEEIVELIYADAGFDDLPLGKYIVVVRHKSVEPLEVKYEVTIADEDEVVFLTFVYLEPERVFLKVSASTEMRL